MIGTKLAHYQITHHLGSGGFGDVYQATDSKLGRSVAIKLLPEAFSHDADRVARFKREARVLASLNHPNIAAIYGFEESDGRSFIVMEFVPEETLAERIKRGAIPVTEALGIATQIVDALEAAHEKTVVHRDLKLANAKITPDGKVKVLDFGLAKALEEFSPGASRHASPEGPEGEGQLSDSPTLLSAEGTEKGVILGTPAYMSPEQAKGRQVDRRADIFAFGAVLYEMLTGRAAFEGEDVSEILARVIDREPDWSRLPANVPPRIRELLHVCLQKDAKKRRQTATDIRIDLDHAETAPPAQVEGPLPPGEGGAQRRVRVLGFTATLATALAVALSIPAALHLREQPVEAPEMRLEVNTPASQLPLEFALSPDGTKLVFIASDNGTQRLWVRSLNTVAAQPLPGTDGANFPFWSPDSRSIGFFAGGKLKRIEIDGGPPQNLADALGPRGGAWNREGVILFAPLTTGPLARIPATGGAPEIVTHLEQGQSSHRFPQFLPDGRHFVFYTQGIPDQTGIYLASLDGGAKRLVAASAAGAWAPPGWLLYVQEGILRAQLLDIDTGALISNPMAVADPVGYDGNLNNAGFSVSAAGTVAYRGGASSRTQLSWFDRTGKTVGVVGDPDETNSGYPELSPDGRRVAVDRVVQGNTDIWLIDLLRGGATRLTFDAAVDRRPVWSPDGTQIAFTSIRETEGDLYMKASSGVGTDRPLLESSNLKVPYDWTPDSRFLLYREDDPKTGPDVWALPMSGANASPAGRSQEKNDGDRKPVAVANSPFYEGNGQFSPDGRWVAYHSNESGRYEIYVVPFPEPGGKWQISIGGGISLLRRGLNQDRRAFPRHPSSGNL